MNSNFSNSNFGRVLYVAIITLIVAATIFVIWYMTAGYKLGTYGADTRLGSVYIAGLTEEEVTPRLDEKINYWYNDETILFELEYQGYTYAFNRNLFFFDIDESLHLINDGVINEISIYYQGTDREGVVTQISNLEFLDNVIENVDLDRLINDVLYDASLMKSFSIKNVEDYLLQPAVSEDDLSSIDLIIPESVELDVLIDLVLEKYPDGYIIVEKESLFDVVEVFGDNMNDSEMTVLASAMLALVLETNFIVNEVHYKPTIEFEQFTLENYPYYARNARTAEVINESFTFYNPNASAYMFKINELTATLSLSGLPFEYEIVVEVNRTELPFITEGTLNVDSLRNGHEGVIIEVTRTIYNLSGDIVSAETNILFEFYPPVKEIVFDPLS
ncbi:hypothetical protein KQ51_01104 [Candidatus Izimaplasma bacterium HR1]|jgi:hypothetical protein|uniref:hypothetical protein n=1 Tax=Candidatus Izimoplasma sp. HR1 TaxID=1541959 RepID=UPI0004F5D5D7|nr:hypothetical protein KQ51_01104 [Candidatus Izimaplasma bacterium HR1]